MSNLDLSLSPKGEVRIEPGYNGRIDVVIGNVDIDDVISEIGLGTLLSNMDIDEVISELESKGYTITEE